MDQPAMLTKSAMKPKKALLKTIAASEDYILDRQIGFVLRSRSNVTPPSLPRTCARI
jgi:hypothetical protein